MTATAVAPSITTGPSRVQVLRIALVAVAIVVLLAAAFAIGRITASSAHAAPVVTLAPVVTPTTTFCHLGRPC